MDKMTDTNTERKYNHKLKVLRTEVIFQAILEKR